jgi:hypothetical protein
MRFAYSSEGLLAAPYAIPIDRSVSQSRGKGNLYFSANLVFAFSSSKLAPRIWVFLAVYSSMRSRNPEPSAVQPGVSAFG